MAKHTLEGKYCFAIMMFRGLNLHMPYARECTGIVKRIILLL